MFKLCPLEIISTQEHSYDVVALLAGSPSILMTFLSPKVLDSNAAPRCLQILLPVFHRFWVHNDTKDSTALPPSQA